MKPMNTLALALPLLTFGLGLSGQVRALDVTCDTATEVVEFNFTGGEATFTVPTPTTNRFSNLHLQTFGAQGGSGATGVNNSSGDIGAEGGFVEGDLSLPTPGTVLSISVGGQGGTPTGGFNGGGNGGSQNAGGGGATDVRMGGTALADRIIVGGGGGGGGGGGRAGCNDVTIAGGNGGFGGGGSGANGTDAPTNGGVAGGGKGGTVSAFGAAGIGCGGFLGAPGSAPSGGTGGGAGGADQSCCCSSTPGGGDGGGGVDPGFGGGGGSAGTTGCVGNDKGAGGGGAGGTSSTGELANPFVTPGSRLGNGLARVCYSLKPLGITVTPTSGLVTTESGTQARFTVVLDTLPSANVVVKVASSDLTEGAPSAATLTFTTANWYTPQTVTVTGVNDASADGDIGFSILLGPVTSTDTNYSALDPDNVTLTNQDNDDPGVTVTPTSGLVTAPRPGSWRPRPWCWTPSLLPM